MMRYMMIAAAALVGGLGTTEAKASFITGERLYADCTAPESDPAYGAKAAACMMFIVGVYDMLELSQDLNDERRCIPGGVNIGQLRDAVVNYMRNNPQHRSFEGAGLVVVAIQQNYRCIVPTTRTRGGSQSRQN